jgi:hypothetical protein
VIVILRLANGKMLAAPDKKHQEEEKEPVSFDDKVVKYVFLPTGRLFLIYNTTSNILYLFQILLDGVILGYHMKPLKNPTILTI